MNYARDKQIEMRRSYRLLAVVLVPLVAIILGVAAPQVWAYGGYCVDPDGLDDAEVFFEFNSTDLDLGIQFFWDGQAWKSMLVKNEQGKVVLHVGTRRNLRQLGLTEGFFESSEPPLVDNPDTATEDEINRAIQDFLNQFPEGTYRFKGMTVDGCLLKGEAELSHELPDAPAINSPDEESETLLQDFLADPTIVWESDSSVEEYEVVIEVEFDGSTLVDTATLPGGSTQYKGSQTFIDLIKRINNAGLLEVLKFEVIAITDNKTITEVVVFEEE